MNMDSIVLTFKSVTAKMKTDLSEAISKWQSLDNATSKTSNSIKNLGNPLDSLKSKLKATQEEYNKLNSTVKKFSDSYGVSQQARNYTTNSSDELRGMYENAKKEYSSLMSTIESKSKELENITDVPLYNKAFDSLNELKNNLGEVLTRSTELKQALQFRDETGTSYDNAILSLQNYQAEIDMTRSKIEELSTSTPDISPNSEEARQNIEDVGDEAEESSGKVRHFKSTVSSLGSSFSQISKSIKDATRSFSRFHNSFGKGVDNTFKKVRKLALGLIGVRTVMSMLTKSVNAYLSFDSELQESLTNSWNTLGALLAPAIEKVAYLFSLATTYVAQFVQALTGVDLIARANAKALETQAKATQKASNAQRGLLGMDEITNLPTESIPNPANQIKEIGIEPSKTIDDIVKAFKSGKWHILGEEVGKSISKALKNIPWDEIKENAHQIGHNLADFLNGAFEFGWDDLGITIGQGVNTALNGANGFLETFSFVQFGKGLAKTTKKTFKEIDWEEVANTLSDSLIGVLDTITAFLGDEELASTIGNSIATLIKKIKWKEIGEAIGKAIMNGFKSYFSIKESFFKGLFGDVGGSIADFFTTNALPMGIFGNVWKILGLDTGTPEIKTEGIYHLHEGEMVVPKKYNPSTSGIDNSKDNKQIIDLLISLNSNMVQYANRPINMTLNGKRVAEGTYGYLQDISRNENKSTVVVRS